jgi:hypothetical protein
LKWYAQFAPNYLAGGAYVARRKVVIDKIHYAQFMHRVIMGRILNRELSRNEWVDHVHHNTLDNRRKELRLASPTENARNRRLSSNNSSGYKGVVWREANQNWESQIKVNGVLVHLGNFSNPIEAALVYDTAAKEHFKEFAFLNFPKVIK